jgi:hypothetical protein
MNRDLALLLAGYCPRPIITRLIAIDVADNFAMNLRRLRLSGEYYICDKVPLHYSIVKLYEYIYDDKRRLTKKLYDTLLIRVFLYINKNLTLYILEDKDADIYTILWYKYNKNFNIEYTGNRLFKLIYNCDGYDIKYFWDFIYNHNIHIAEIFYISKGEITFKKRSKKLFGYTNFTKYYKNGTIFIRSYMGNVIIYYDNGAILMELTYISARFYENYSINMDSLCIYSPYGTRLL